MGVVGRIRCLGYFDKCLSDVSQIESVMQSIEAGKIARPEFELVSVENGTESMVHVAALFQQGGGARCLGWIVTRALGNPRKRIAYSLNASSNPKDYKKVLLCGSPESIESSAILSHPEAVALLGSFVGLGSDVKHECRPFLSIFESPA